VRAGTLAIGQVWVWDAIPKLHTNVPTMHATYSDWIIAIVSGYEYIPITLTRARGVGAIATHVKLKNAAVAHGSYPSHGRLQAKPPISYNRWKSNPIGFDVLAVRVEPPRAMRPLPRQAPPPFEPASSDLDRALNR
jgi:hypothetical protein